MHIKRFEGSTMAEALARVREQLGPDALVLSTRSVRRQRGYFGLMGRSVVEVMAAAEPEPEATPRRPGAPDPSWRDLRLSRALVDPLEAEIRSLRDAVDRLSARPSEAGSLADEVAALRRSLAPRREPEDVERLARSLDPRLRPPREDDARVELIVGPPGAGKTTTLAKLAARGLHEAPPLLVSTDVHRLGADAGLRAFARRQGLAYEAAPSPEALATHVGRGRGRVLVDTAGVSRRDPRSLGELARLREALGANARVRLVLPATDKEADLFAAVDRFGALEPDDLVVTRFDESLELSNVARVLLDPKTPPLAWLGTGQRVPEDLELPEPEPLAEQLVSQGVAA